MKLIYDGIYFKIWILGQNEVGKPLHLLLMNSFQFWEK